MDDFLSPYVRFRPLSPFFLMPVYFPGGKPFVSEYALGHLDRAKARGTAWVPIHWLAVPKYAESIHFSHLQLHILDTQIALAALFYPPSLFIR